MANHPFKIAGIVAGALIGVASAAYGTQKVVVRSLANSNVDFEFHVDEQFVLHTRDNTRLVLYRDGPRNVKKPTIIFLHGVALCSPIWAYQFDILRESYDIIAVDLRGHGASSVGEDGITIQSLANDIVDVIDKLELDRVILVGHSTGGIASMAYMDEYPKHASKHLAGLCLVSTLGQSPYGYMEGLAAALQQTSFAGNAFHLLSDIPLVGFPMMRFGLGKKASNAIAEFVRRCIVATDRDVCVRYIQILAKFNFLEALSNFTGPSTMIVGTSDPVTPLRDAQLVAETLGTTETIIKDVGHCPMLESPDEFNNALLDFLDNIKEL